MPFVTRQVSEPYRNTDLTLVLRIRMLFTLYTECRLMNEGLSCFSNPGIDILVCACATACS
ncbi:unnamed protein product [Heterobilharzia americana]|nr:unnamed protein product [Heterobilharzia americana]